MSEPSKPDGGQPDAVKPPEAAPAETKPAPAPAAAVAAKPAPVKPAAAAPASKERRAAIISAVAVAWLAFTGTMVAWLLGSVRFLFPNVLSEPPSKLKVGFPDQFEDGKVVERYKDQNTWIVRHQGQIFALSTTCTHLGCTPNWLESAAKFKCPCHGSGFYINGVNFEGPAPRPLERWAISLGEDGQIVVDKSRKFQKELGQWDNPDSFLKV